MAEMKTLQAIVISLMIIGIVLGIGFIVLEEFEANLGTNSTTITNESVTPTDTGTLVAFNSTTAGTFCYNSFTVTGVVNGSTKETINSANYSYEPATGKIWNLTSEFSLTPWNVTYTYNHNDGEACSGLNDTITATKVIPTWLTIIVLILIVGVLLFLVFKAIPQFTSGNPTGAEGSIAQV